MHYISILWMGNIWALRAWKKKWQIFVWPANISSWEVYRDFCPLEIFTGNGGGGNIQTTCNYNSFSELFPNLLLPRWPWNPEVLTWNISYFVITTHVCIRKSNTSLNIVIRGSGWGGMFFSQSAVFTQCSSVHCTEPSAAFAMVSLLGSRDPVKPHSQHPWHCITEFENRWLQRFRTQDD